MSRGTPSMKLSERTLEELWQLFPILLQPYNQEWPQWYAEEVNGLHAVLKQKEFRVRHIGSTSVPGLTAKPTVDILLEIPIEDQRSQMEPLLMKYGYCTIAFTEEPPWRWDLCKGYTEQGFAAKVFHLHVRRFGDWDEPYFCEYLRKHPEIAAEYVQLKTVLAAKFKYNRDAYTEAKGEFIRQKTFAARAELQNIEEECRKDSDV